MSLCTFFLFLFIQVSHVCIVGCFCTILAEKNQIKSSVLVFHVLTLTLEAFDACTSLLLNCLEILFSNPLSRRKPWVHEVIGTALSSRLKASCTWLEEDTPLKLLIHTVRVEVAVVTAKPIWEHWKYWCLILLVCCGGDAWRRCVILLTLHGVIHAATSQSSHIYCVPIFAITASATKLPIWNYTLTQLFLAVIRARSFKLCTLITSFRFTQ